MTALLIAGPTASGKSALALEIADAIGGEIINADSMQVYRDLRILTACPTAADTDRVPHHLYGYIDGAEAGSMVRWVADAVAVFDQICARGNVPIFVGGTGLYFRALVDGFAHIPDIDPAIRGDVRALVDNSGAPAAHAALIVEDPDMATRLAPGDGQRVARALEVVRSTGRSLAHWQADTKPGPLAPLLAAGQLHRAVLDMDRVALYARCDQRLQSMLDAGGLDELAVLLDRHLPEDFPVMRALGVPQLRPYVEGRLALADCLARAQQETRRFAKRQMTWFRNQCGDWDRIFEKQNNDYIAKIRHKIIKNAVDVEI